jgi:hypothetical protein
MAEAMSEEKQEDAVEIYPLKKTWRIGVFLADYFIAFFLALFLYQVCLYPLAGLIISSQSLSEELVNVQNERDSVLYGNHLLFAKKSQDITSFSDNLESTGDSYLSYFVTNSNDSSLEIFHTYFVTLRKDEKSYQNFYESNDTSEDFFIWSETKPVLQAKYVSEFAPHFDPNDALSSQGEKDLATFMASFYLKGYSTMLSDILTNDLTYNGISYLSKQNRVRAIEKTQEMTVVVTALISYALTCSLLFLLFPCLNKNRKTIGMMALRIERVNASRLVLLRKRDVLYRFIFEFASCLSGVFFLPMIQMGFNELFALPMLFPLSMVSMGYCLVSLGFVLFGSFNRSLGDLLSGSVMVDEASLDEIYRSKGYLV